jgi:RNA polymerase sigma-B factor
MSLPVHTGVSPTHDRDGLIRRHLALAHSLARRFSDRGETLDDLVQVAMIGLVKAAERFDDTRDIKFSTYATATITGELKRHFRDVRWGLHVTRSSQELYLLVRSAIEWAREDVGRSPTIAEIASRAGVSEEEVLEAQELAGAFHLDSIDAPAPTSDDGGEPPQFGRFDPELNAVEDRVSLEGVLDCVSERERQIIHLRFVEELTQSEIAARVGVSQMQVSRLLSKSLASLRQSLSA